MRQLLQELRQNNFGVITKDTIKMMTSVERNAENMVEVACAYMEQCTGIEAFYDSFQEKVQGSTLYILTISSVTIMPFQLLTGLFGMNFAGDDSGFGEMAELSWSYGYHMFWTIGICATLCILCTMHRKVSSLPLAALPPSHPPHTPKFRASVGSAQIAVNLMDKCYRCGGRGEAAAGVIRHKISKDI